MIAVNVLAPALGRHAQIARTYEPVAELQRGGALVGLCNDELFSG
jgi:hypothetical protein